ncbi:MAG: ATP-binding cassette domain-containing protein [Gammaproteobacteria bacterium]|nr:ATP-binding cassette domain-containing protein [Gammaproteobacteria bacterium]
MTGKPAAPQGHPDNRDVAPAGGGSVDGVAELGPGPEGPEMTDGVLALREFGVAFGERVVLSAVDLEVPARGIVVLMGPGGAGKSTLVRTLAGFNDANPSLRTWGEARYAGAALGEEERPALVSQCARLMMASVLENIVHDLPERGNLTPLQQRDLAARLLGEAGLDRVAERLCEPVVTLPLGLQRRLAVLRLVAARPRLLCVDEPTTGLDATDATALLDYLRQAAKRMAVLAVLHNQRHARRLGGTTALLAGGTIQEIQAGGRFFEVPRTPAARDFVRQGTCSVPAPGTAPEELAEDVAPPPPLPEPARRYVSDALGPRGFLWLKKGVLAGTPRPGVVADVEHDIKGLRRVGVTVLVSLTREPVGADLLARHGIRGAWSYIPDMTAPGLEQAAALCREIQRFIEEGETVAVHCRAGLGRTGTVLAAYLIWEGWSGLDALETARRIEPRWVQSEEQVAFLEEFAHVVANDVAVKGRTAAEGNGLKSSNHNSVNITQQEEEDEQYR